MGEVRHTPGPWWLGHYADDSHPCNCRSVLSEGYAGAICFVEIDNGKSIGEGGNDAPPLEEAKANGRLIAAAPDLMAALEGAIKWCPQCNGDGWYEPALTDSGDPHCIDCFKCAPARAALLKARGES